MKKDKKGISGKEKRRLKFIREIRDQRNRIKFDNKFKNQKSKR